MSAGARGPPGRAPLPPPWLASVDLPVDRIRAATPLVRVHRSIHDPVFFGPGAGNPPTYRFDSACSAFGVLYVGATLTAALVETLLRNPARRMVSYAAIEARASSEIVSGRDLRLVRLYGTGLQQIGCDNAISTGPYEPCGVWADALWDHPSKPDGLAFRSRHNPDEICFALFERTDIDLSCRASEPLSGRLPIVSRILSAYGKSIVGWPS